MTNLTERLSQAEAGSRELSDEVLLACGWVPTKFDFDGGLGAYRRPSPTESVDDALALVPEGWIVARMAQNDDHSWSVELRRGFLPSYGEVTLSPVLGTATPALALCIAILRALQEKSDG